MKVSSVQNNENCCPRRNLFISYANSFMSKPEGEEETSEVNESQTVTTVTKPEKMGIETLEHFTIFPKEVKDGKTIITA